MSNVNAFIPNYRREPGNHSFEYTWHQECDRSGNYFNIRKVSYINKKQQSCSEVIQVVHLGKTPNQ